MSAPPRGLAGSAAVMFSGTLVSRLLGLVRNVLLVAAIGVTGAANSFAVANRLPNIIYMLVAGGVLNAVLVPQIVRAMKSRDSGQEYVNRLLTLAGAALLGLTLLLTAGAGVLVSIYAAELDPRWFSLAIAFAIWCIPQIFFYGMYTLLGQVLNARAIFGPYMWAPAVNNIVAILGLLAYIVVFGPASTGAHLDPEVWSGLRIALIAGTATVGVATQALVLIVPLRRAGFHYRPKWGLRGSGLGRASRVAMWAFAGLAAAQAGFIAVSNLAASASSSPAAGTAFVPGNAAWDNAFFLYMLPQSLITVSLVTALFTRMSDYAADRNLPAVRSDLSLALRTIAVFTVFAGPALAVVGLPLVQAVLPTTTLPEAAGVARVLVPLLAGIPALGAFTMIQRVYYAFEDTRTLFRIQLPLTLVVILGCLLATFLPPAWWLVGAGAATTASNVLGSVIGYLALRRKLPSLDGSRVVITHVRLVLAAVPPLLVGWLLLYLVGPAATAEGTALRLVQAVGRVALVGGVMALGYLLMLRLLRVSELDVLLQPLGRGMVGLAPRLPAALATPCARLGTALARSGAPRTMSPAVPPGGAAGSHGRSGTLDAHRAELDATLRVGAVINARYRLLRPGAAPVPGGASWVGHDSVLDRDVALLVLPAEHPGVAETQDAARRASLVDDPRLQRVLDVGQDDTLAWVITEIPRGPSLAELCATGPLAPPQARAVVGEAASALDAARRRGVHHLALSPGLVHVTPDGGVTISGLGVVAAALGITTTDVVTTSDGAGLVRLLYLTLTGHWPVDEDDPAESVRVLGAGAQLPAAPVHDGSPASPEELVPGLPGDLVTLTSATLVAGRGPRTAGDVIRELAPWPEIEPPPSPTTTSASETGADTPPGGVGTLTATGAAPIAVPEAGDPPPAPPPAVLDTTRWRPRGLSPGATAPADFDVVLGDGAEAARDDPARGETSLRHRSGDGTAAVVTAAVAGAWAATAAAARRTATAVATTTRTTTDRLQDAREQRTAARHDREEAAEAERRAADVDAALGQAEPTAPHTAPPTVPTEAATAPDRAAPEAPPADTPPAARTPGAAPRPYPSSAELFPTGAAASDVPFSQRRINPTPIVLGLFLLLVVLGTVLAIKTLGAQPDGLPAPPEPIPATSEPSLDEAGPTEEAEEASPTEEPTPELPEPAIDALAPLDPEGDGAENPDLIPQALDGDSSTFWRSRSYVDPSYGMKSGIGLAVELEEESLVSAVTINLMGQGGNVEIRAADADSPTDGDVLAEGEMGPDSTFTFEEPVATDRLVLWFTQLPVAASDGKNRIELAELGVE